MAVIAYLEKNDNLRKYITHAITDQLEQAKLLEAQCWQKFSSKYATIQPDVILQSVYEDRPENPEDLLLTLRDQFPFAKIIICDQPDAEFNLLSYFQWGASAILCPGDLKFEIGQCVTNVLAGERFLGNEATSRILENIPDMGWL